MNRMSAAALRQLFLDFFKNNGHSVVKSSPLIPANDPTLMFTNAGMVQFKDVFVGAETRPYKRAVTCQKVMRVSGKHNDLEEVGRTARHHTFFEMLGNFSFGDYFKEQAIHFAWDFITKDVGLDKSKLWITVFEGAEGLPADTEAAELWHKISGLPRERIIGKGMKDNFWSMGDVGPCGPCTEIHFDQGEGTPTEADFDNGRVMEIWNNVFMQFDRQPGGKLVNLPAPSVDTGMGLERLIALVQSQDSNYHSDLFMPLIESIAQGVGKPYQKSPSEDDVSMRVIADHARATAFLVADGVQPSNEGRGYVMRRIMRRAIRHGKRLGFDDLFLHKACDVVVQNMSPAYPELTEARSLIGKVAQLEEEGFRRTLDTGLKILGDEVQSVKAKKAKALSGDVVFKLYDTYGFPKDLTEVIAQEQGLTVDDAGFTTAMEAQKERSRGSDVGSAAVASVYKQLAQRLGPMPFVGYPAEDTPLGDRPGTWRMSEVDGYPILEVESTVRALVQNDVEVQAISEGDGDVVLDPTPFYGESGGQVGDAGRITIDDPAASALVLDTQRPLDSLTIAKVRMGAGTLRVGDKVWAGYYPATRRETRAHHSATHLLHGALRKVLGEHVKQAGSLVDAHHLRFDFSHFSSLTPQEINAIERDVQRRVDERSPIVTEELTFDAAKAKGAIALFGEKYGDEVRVLSMGESVEFCGGTHASNTGDIGLLLIAREEAVQSGVRRILAEVSQAVYRRVQSYRDRIDQAVNVLQGKGLHPDANPDGDGEPVLGAIAKAYAQKVSLTEQLKAMGTQPVTEDAGPALKHWPLPATPTIGLPEAQALRDTWACLVQLINGRIGDIPQVLERFGSLDRDRADILPYVAALLQGNREMERVLESERKKAQTSQAGDLIRDVKTIGTTPVLMTQVDNVEGAALRELADALRSKLPSGVVCIGARNGDKCALLITVSKDLTGKLAAGKLVQSVASLIDGRGGGKPEMAQAGGQKPDGLPQAFAALETQISQAG